MYVPFCGGFSPLIAASLLAWTGTINAVAAFVAVAAILTIAANVSTTEHYRPTDRRTATVAHPA